MGKGMMNRLVGIFHFQCGKSWKRGQFLPVGLDDRQMAGKQAGKHAAGDITSCHKAPAGPTQMFVICKSPCLHLGDSVVCLSMC